MLDNENKAENALANERTNERTNKRTVYHCFFEQSGTFKNEFRKLGYEAYDYDILDDFGQTDFKIDLFSEIDKAYDGQESIFDRICRDDVIIAFFPCVRFENQIMLAFRGQLDQMKNWNIKQKMQYCMKLLEELKTNYDAVNKLFIICFDRGLRIVMENPYSQEHFLRRYWCYKPAIIDKDRRENGDYFAKPTQFWFLNIEPKNNFLMDAIVYNHIQEKDAIERLNSSMYADRFGKVSLKVARSMIHPTYANRFIRIYLIDGENETVEEYGQMKLDLKGCDTD